MRKAISLSVGVLVLSLCLLVASPSLLAGHSHDVDVYVNGVKVVFPDQKPFIDATVNITYVPLRFVSEALGAEVEWDGSKRRVVITQQNKEINMKIGSRNATIDGEAMFVGVSAKLVNERTMVPLRFVSEVLGAEVDWIPPAGTGKGKVLIVPGSDKLEPPQKSGCPGGGGCGGCGGGGC